MYYSAIKKNDVANGPGVRVNLFVSGCSHHCKECFNAGTWNFHNGNPFSDEELSDILTAMKPSYVAGFTFLGGEPMEPENRGEVLRIARRIREAYPDKSIWCYTGYLTEELLAWAGLWDESAVPSAAAVPRNVCFDSYAPSPDAEELSELLGLIDIIVDGEFQIEKKNLRLMFRGSENQRIIDLGQTVKEGKIVLWSGLTKGR